MGGALPPLALATIVALAIAAAGVGRRVRRWRRGRVRPVALARGLRALPRRYLRDLHDVVARDRAAARMHVPVAAGLVAVVILLVCTAAAPGARWLGALLVLAGAAMLVGALLDALRRRRDPRARAGHLSQGYWNAFPYVLAAYALLAIVSGVGVLHPPAQATGGALLALALVPALAVIAAAGWADPLKHAVTGAAHLVVHPRPERFGDGDAVAPTALRPLALEGATLGVTRARDFHWNDLAGFDSCVQCGRCEAACPAYAAGQPLNPKKLIQDLAAAALADAGRRPAYAGHGHPGLEARLPVGDPDAPLVGTAISAATLWACTTCRACVYECPMMIEHVDAVVELRRAEVLERGRVPGQGLALLDNLRATDNTRGLAARRRGDWARGLDVPHARDAGRVDWLLWAGDFAFEPRNHSTLRALVRLLQRAGVSFAILGDDEVDCGDAARRLGDEATFRDLANRAAALLRHYDFGRIVTPDPHALHALGTEYRSLGHAFDTVHHTTLMAGLLHDGRLSVVRPLARRVTYHDPCYLGRYGGEYEAPRRALTAIGATLVEMERAGPRSRCCGGGGGAPVTDVPGARRIPDMRMDDARATAAATVAVACPQCMVMLDGVAQPHPEVRDVAELVADAVGVS